MRVRISTNPPLPPVRAWFPLAQPSANSQTISTFKSVLCTTLAAFRDISPSALHLSIDGFELLDNTDLTVVRDGDLISVEARDDPPKDATASPRRGHGQAVDQGTLYAGRPRVQATSRKRKRTPSTASSGSESDTESSTESESESSSASETSSRSESDVWSVPSAKSPVKGRAQVGRIKQKAQPTTFVPPGYGKPQTQARNRRRRLKRMHEREAASESGGGPVSGANAVGRGNDAPVQGEDAQAVPGLMSLSLRNKNKAKNFKSLINRPLPPKIIFGDEEGISTGGGTPAMVPRLIPPSLRSSLPPNVFVTSVDVEADLDAERGDSLEQNEVDVSLDYGTEQEVDVDEVEAMAKARWVTLDKLTREMEVAPGMLVGYEGLGIDPVTCTPGQVLTVVRVETCDGAGVAVRPLRAASFGGWEKAEAEEHPWEEIEGGDWRVM